MELLRLVRSSNVEYDNMLERLLTQETAFCAIRDCFPPFEQQVLPEMQERKFWDKESALRIWSAGCASGEEPYSIALSICDAAGLSAGPRGQHHGHRRQPRGPGARRPRGLQPSARWKIFRRRRSPTTLPGRVTTTR